MTQPDWIWYGEDDDGSPCVSTGRWPLKAFQVRYKIADIQPTEHDHTEELRYGNGQLVSDTKGAVRIIKPNTQEG